MYREEINRRWALNNQEISGIVRTASPPRSAGWNQLRMIQWLDDNPITDIADVEFLRKIVATKVKDCLEELDQEKIDNAKMEKSWTGSAPFMRLIHCFIDNDEIKSAFLHRNDVDSSRMTVENRNSVNKRKETVWEMVAAKWNDQMFFPETEAIEDLHADFVESTTLFHNDVEKMYAATADRVQAKFSTMNTELTRIINNWEMSGQGEGGQERGDGATEQDLVQGGDIFGCLADRPAGALHRRAAFCGHSASYILYMWEMFYKHQLLRSSMQRLNEEVSAANGANGVPSVIFERSSVSAAGVVVNDDVLLAMSTHGDRVFAGLRELGSSQETIARSNENVARMHGVQEREKLRRLGRQEREKLRHNQLENLRASIDSLIVEKRLLIIEISKHTDHNVTRELLMEALDELRITSATKVAELAFLEKQRSLQLIQDEQEDEKSQEQSEIVVQSPDNRTPVRQREGNPKRGDDRRNLEQMFESED
jgi:hypothetical protein